MNIQPIITTYAATSLEHVSPVRLKPGTRTQLSAPSMSEQQEQVEFSTAAQELKSVREKIDSLPEVRTDLAFQIRKRIEDNDYPLENRIKRAIDKMLEVELLNAA